MLVAADNSGMRKQGTIVQWRESRSFGLIRATDSKTDVMFRGRDFSGQPAQGLAVEFDEVLLGGRALHAHGVTPVDTAMAAATPRRAKAASVHLGDDLRPKQKRRGATPALLGIVAYYGLLVGATVTDRISVPMLIAVPIFNLFVFFLYWHNKDAARRGGMRLHEDLLHVLAALGGWSGAWLAQRLLRYKPTTPWFERTYWIATGIHNVALLGWLFLA